MYWSSAHPKEQDSRLGLQFKTKFVGGVFPMLSYMNTLVAFCHRSTEASSGCKAVVRSAVSIGGAVVCSSSFFSPNQFLAVPWNR